MSSVVTETTLLQSKDARCCEVYGDCSQLLYHPKLTLWQALPHAFCSQFSCVRVPRSSTAAVAVGPTTAAAAVGPQDGGGYIYNRSGAHSSYDDRRHRLTVTTLVTTARARAAAVSCSAFVGGVAGVSHTGIFVCFFA